jgi:anti-anti-sigma regulatory factor
MTATLTLPAELTIYSVTQLRTAWLDALLERRQSAAAGTALLSIDAAAVDEVDAAGVQLLVALAKSLRADGTSLELRNASGPLSQACQRLGVCALLGAAAPAGKQA